jgi:hypothetical protein
VYQPRNWANLRSRPEIAARLYADRLFGDATFDRLARGSRPYLILNATDMSTGNRFEFTQEQFDLLCGDLAPFPVARAVAASSAFPGLLNSMTIDSYNVTTAAGRKGCGYSGPGSGSAADWVPRVIASGSPLDFRYAVAREILAYRDETRLHLHLLDGGLADNIGLRSVLQSLRSTDRPTDRVGDRVVQGGWSLQQMVNNKRVKTILVFVVNAKTSHSNDWDLNAAGPGSLSVAGVSSGAPMSNYSSETVDLLRQAAIDGRYNEPGQPELYGIQIAFDDLPTSDERTFFANLGTSLELRPFEVDCLIDRGQRLTRAASIATAQGTRTLDDFVQHELLGSVETPPDESSTGTAPTACTETASESQIGVRTHFLDIGVQSNSTIPRGSGFARRIFQLGVTFRIVRPNGWNVLLGVGPQSLSMTQTVGGRNVNAGDLKLFSFVSGVAHTWQAGRLEATTGVAGGYGIGSFALSQDVRDAFGRQGEFAIHADATNAWLLEPRAGFWFNLNDRFAATASASWSIAHSTVSIGSDHSLVDRKLDASALRVGVGLGVKIF